MSDFEKWFKTTSAYRMLESMNYYKMDLFHWVEARGEYRHTSVQIAFMTWVEQQDKIDELQKRVEQLESNINNLTKQFSDCYETAHAEYKKNADSYYSGKCDAFDLAEQLAGLVLRGEHE